MTLAGPGLVFANSANTGTVQKPAVYAVKEYEHVAIPPADLLRDGSLHVFPSVMQRGYFDVRPGPGPLVLQAGGYIGVIPLNDRVTIDVRSRVPVANLSRILRISEETPVSLEGSIRSYQTEPDMFPALVDVYARALADYVGDIALRGLLREYVRREEITSFPRGRILRDQTLKSLAPKGLTHKVATAFHERTADNPANQCLKYAVWLLAQLRSSLQPEPVKGQRETSAALNRAYGLFSGVTLDVDRHFLRDPTVTGRLPLPSVRFYYRRALDLALAVIHQHAVTLDGGREQIVMPSLVLNMAAAFESYLRNVLVAQAKRLGWPGQVLDGNLASPAGGMKPLFDSGEKINATPDIVLATGAASARSYPLLIEVKYKPAHVPSRDDVNQTVAYGVSYRCRDVILAQPRGAQGAQSPGMRKLGTMRDLTVHQYVFDLNAADMKAEENRFGAAVQDVFAEAVPQSA